MINAQNFILIFSMKYGNMNAYQFRVVFVAALHGVRRMNSVYSVTAISAAAAVCMKKRRLPRPKEKLSVDASSM